MLRPRFSLLLAALAMALGTPAARANQLFDSFEFNNQSGLFTLGSAPYTATFANGHAKTVFNFSLYFTGTNSWMVDDGDTATVTFGTPPDGIDLWYKDQNVSVNSVLTVFAPGGATIQSFNGTTSWVNVVVGGPIGSIQLTNNAPVNGYTVIDDFQASWTSAINYCTAGTTASGCNATMSATGTASLSAASGFDVAVSTVEGSKDGILFFGTSGRQSGAWGNGTSFRCVLPPVSRTGLQSGVGTSGACDGSFSLDFNAWMSANPTKAPSSGDIVDMQCWFRDPQNTSNQTTSLSDAIEFCVTP